MSKRLLIPALLLLVTGLSISFVHSLLAEDKEPATTFLAPPPLPETPAEVVFEGCAGGSLNCAAEESASKVAGLSADQETDEQEEALNELVARLRETERQIESLNEERSKVRELLTTKSPEAPLAATIRERKQLVNRLQAIDRHRMQLKQHHSQLSRTLKSSPHLVQFYPDFLEKSAATPPCTVEYQDVKRPGAFSPVTLEMLEEGITIAGNPNVDILRVNRDQPQHKTHGRVDADVPEEQLKKSLEQLDRDIEATEQDIKDKAARARKIAKKMHTLEEGETEPEVLIDDEVQHNICMLDLRHSQRVHTDLLKRRSHTLERLNHLENNKRTTAASKNMPGVPILNGVPYISHLFNNAGVAQTTEGAAGEHATPILEKLPNLQSTLTAKDQKLYIKRSRPNVGVPTTGKTGERVYRNIKGPEFLQISNEPIPDATQVLARGVTIQLSGDGQVSAVAVGKNSDGNPQQAQAQAQGVFIITEGDEKKVEPKKDQPKQPQVFKLELKGEPQIRIVEGGEHPKIKIHEGEEQFRELMKRVQHLHQAAENLEQAGDHDLARQLHKKAEHMEAEVRKHREQLEARMHEMRRHQAEVMEKMKAQVQRERGGDQIAELKEIIADLRHEVRALRKEMHELREAIEEDDDDDDDDREGDDKREREGDRGDRERGEREQDRDRRESSRPAGDRELRDHAVTVRLHGERADPAKVKSTRRRLQGAQVFERVAGSPVKLAPAEIQFDGDGQKYRIRVLQLNLEAPAAGDDAVEAKKPESR